MSKLSKSKHLVLPVTVLAVLLLSISILPSGLAEDRTNGKVIRIRDGKLKRLSGSAWEQIKENTTVFLGDRLKTDKGALAVIELPGIGRFVIGPDTEIELGKDSKDFNGSLTRGAAWLTSDLPKGSKVKIKTSLATAGIRGTAFTVCYDGKNFCACTCLGEVEVILDTGGIIRVPKGKYISFASDSPVPRKAQPALPLIEEGASAFDFCFNCHIPGGKGKLREDLGQYIPLR